MRPLQTDLSIFEKFKFEKPPVAVKFMFFKPEGIGPIDKKLPACEMIKEAQQRGTPFYFTKENENCFGKVPLGMEEMPPWGEGGELGPGLEIFQEPRANTRIYQYLPKFPKGTVNYVALSSLDKLTFEPDLLILMATPSQAEIVLRAMSYSTGEIWESKTTGVLGCAWIFGLSISKRQNQLHAYWDDLLRESTPTIPGGRIPIVTQNLKEMKWVLPSYADGREKYLKRRDSLITKLTQKSVNP